MFGIDMSGDLKPGPTELNLGIIHADRRNADLIMTGPHRVVHLEFQSRADPAMANRMLIYQGMLRGEPDHADKRLHQHVIVLGKGTSPTRIYEPPNLFFRFETHYARTLDPDILLDDPECAPWAVLAATTDDKERAARLVAIFQAVTFANEKSEAVRRDLIQTALTFATLVMKRENIERALKEVNMPVDMIHDTVWAQELIEEGRVESNRTNTVRILERRGIDHHQAELIAKALLDQNLETPVERAAFDDLEQLRALVDQND
ncbi:hypothetical protein [Actinoplanes derwentensis]|uniref:Transposase, YhgA-like n=1 Tax=Actinoplanes derwentensis TaxID=113562 RepID=A0A1H2CPN0_9ACTN|nr:hypothetical protein [Actinoplanes derwentensis]GID83916.1 hypothetical protein Ade03nite_28400 [Actinoplanes derwentensis]SDT72279.1 hypothetical protein SAMN04489716_6372 [Actinoplanes derwentensis]